MSLIQDSLVMANFVMNVDETGPELLSRVKQG